MTKRLLIGILSLCLAGMPLVVFAQGSNGVAPTGSNGALPSCANGSGAGCSVTVSNPLGNNVNSLCGLIKAVLNGVLEVGIPIAVLFLVWAGFKFVLAIGNPNKLDEARRNLYYTIIGIAIFFASWLIGQLIANTINNVSQGTGVTISACN